MTTAIESNVGTPAEKSTNDFASKEYVQKEHKETTRLIVALSLRMLAASVLTSVLMTFGFNHSVGARLDTIQADMKSMSVKIDSIEKTNNAIAANVARLDGYVQGQAQTKAFKNTQ